MLSQPGGDRPARERARVLVVLGPEHLAEVMQIADVVGDDDAAAHALVLDIDWHSRDTYEEMFAAFDAVVDRASRVRSGYIVAIALSLKCHRMQEAGDVVGAVATGERALAILAGCDDDWWVSHAHHVLGVALTEIGDLGRAAREIDIALSLAGPDDLDFKRCWRRFCRAHVSALMGALQEARALYAESLRWAMGDDEVTFAQQCRTRLRGWFVAEILVGAVTLAVADGDLERAAVLRGAADAALQEDVEFIASIDRRTAGARDRAILQESLGVERYEALLAQGRALSLADAVARSGLLDDAQ